MERGSDLWKMGRWLYVKIKGKNNTSLLIITGYRVGKRTGSSGPTTAWSQQHMILKATDRSQAPHTAFLTDLAEWLSKDQYTESELVINLDANEKWSENSEITTFARNLGLVNLSRDFHLDHTHPNSTDISKSTTIDFCLCTEKVMESITYAGSTPYDLESEGDHRGFIIDLNIKTVKRHVRIGSQKDT